VGKADGGSPGQSIAYGLETSESADGCNDGISCNTNPNGTVDEEVLNIPRKISHVLQRIRRSTIVNSRSWCQLTHPIMKQK
jgi:hypothetical protein